MYDFRINYCSFAYLNNVTAFYNVGVFFTFYETKRVLLETIVAHEPMRSKETYILVITVTQNNTSTTQFLIHKLKSVEDVE
jgi:hypothetical protein